MPETTSDTMSDADFLQEQMKEEERLNLLRAANKPVEPGKVWMGQNISPDQFQRLPQGARITPPPPALSPDQQAALQRRIATATSPEPAQVALARMQAADRPGTRTIGVESDPGRRRFEAQEQIRRAGGTPEAFMLYGQDMFPIPKATAPPKPIKLGLDGVGILGPDGSLKVLRQPTLKTTTPKPAIYRLKAADESTVTGPASDPAIAELLAQRKIEQDAAIQTKKEADIANAEPNAISKFFGAKNPLRPAAPPATATTPAFQPPAGTSATSQKVTTKAQFDALPSGTIYISTDGKRHRKP